MSGEDKPRGTTLSDEQKEIKNRPRKKPEVVGLLTGYGEVVVSNKPFMNKLCPVKCELENIMFIVGDLSVPEVSAEIIVSDGSVEEIKKFKIKEGRTELDKVISVEKGCTVQARLVYPEQFIADDVHFSATIKT